jgi:hypothetical protein
LIVERHSPLQQVMTGTPLTLSDWQHLLFLPPGPPAELLLRAAVEPAARADHVAGALQRLLAGRAAESGRPVVLCPTVVRAAVPVQRLSRVFSTGKAATTTALPSRRTARRRGIGVVRLRARSSNALV